STLEVLKAYTTNMDSSLPVPQPSSSPDLLYLDAVREVKLIKPDSLKGHRTAQAIAHHDQSILRKLLHLIITRQPPVWHPSCRSPWYGWCWAHRPMASAFVVPPMAPVRTTSNPGTLRSTSATFCAP